VYTPWQLGAWKACMCNSPYRWNSVATFQLNNNSPSYHLSRMDMAGEENMM
jgi:hypothetical protein